MKKLKILLLILTQIFSTKILANNHQIDPKDNVFPITVLKKDTPAPFDGILLPKDKADIIKNQILDLNTCTSDKQSMSKELDLYKQNQTIEQQQVTILLNQNKLLIEQKQQEVKQDEFNKYVIFGSGILVTALSVYLASKLTK